MSEPTPTSEIVAEVMADVHKAHEAWKRARARVFTVFCPSCALDSATMRACGFTGDPECKHKPELDRRSRAAAFSVRCRAAQVPAAYHAEVGRIEPCAALNAVGRVLQGKSLAAVLLGTPGSGKTLCASYALAERGGMFVPASSLDVLNSETAHLIERLCVQPMAVLDDVGRGRSATVLAMDRTEDVICRRYDAGLPTIVTANLLPSEFWSLHAIGGGRVKDRIGMESVTLCREPSRRNPVAFNERGER